MAHVPALVLDHVVKAYHGAPAVAGVSLSVAPGEFVTLLGPSGSGKTTLLLMIAGFVHPDSGRVLFRGEDVTYMPAHLRNVGVVFQNYALFPHMTVRENVAFPLRMRRAPRHEAEARAMQALELVHMADYAARLPAQLSGGQQQRVALARALVYAPTLLLMDEPLAALDRNLRERLQLEIRAIQRATGVTIVYVTHDQQEALVLSDRIVVTERGRIRMEGPARDVYERPRNEFVARFVGETNLLRGSVVSTGHGRVLRLGPSFDLPLAPGGDRGSSGAPAVISLRPERVRCPAPSDGVAFPARVEEVTYLGDSVKYRLALEGGDPPVSLTARQLISGGTVLREGERTTAGWRPDDLWILPETA